MISQFDEAFFRELLLPNMKASDCFTFPRVIEGISNVGEDITKNLLLRFIRKLDESFRYSKDRLNTYYVKDYRSRTIITMIGEITYSRTIYKDKYTNKNYCYVDEKLGIDKYIRYTNDVGACVTDLNSRSNSMIKVGEIIGSSIYSRFTLKDTRKYAIPRQTVYNLLHRAKEVRVLAKNKVKIDDIYILMDEKYIGCQDKDSKDIMVKSAMVIEGLDKTNKRHKYINPYYLSMIGDNLNSSLEDYIFSKYDIDYLKTVHFLSDGGNWIKGISKDLLIDRNKKKRYLDKFHTFKAIWNIYPEKEVYNSLIKSLYKDSKDDLLKLLDSYKETNPNRKDIIEESIKYISNNYLEIKNMLNLKNMNCAMEQAISHHIASIFSSVPKAYSIDNMNLYLSFRDNYRNKENVKELYLKSLTCKEDICYINKPKLDLSSLPSSKISSNEMNYKTRIKGHKIDEDPGLDSGQ